MNDERKLAHIEKIEWIKSIENADNIELCGILGWQCVITKKENHKVGDLVVYIEVDSIVPDIPTFEFLKDRKFRVHTIKLRGEISQGLVLPLDNLLSRTHESFKIGEDVTKEMKIKKYISPAELQEMSQQISKHHWTKLFKVTKWLWRYKWFRNFILPKRIPKNFPSWVSKTDEERIQNIPHILEQFKDEVVYVTEKIDYQSVTFTTNPKDKKHKLIVASRNTIVTNKNSLYYRIAEKYGLERTLKENSNLTIQGEQGDINVQGNKYKIIESKFWVFNIINHKECRMYNYDEMVMFCIDNGLIPVPYIIKGVLNNLASHVTDVIKLSKGNSVINPNIKREGIVVRCIKDGKKIMSWKCVNPDFLL